jgi:hypothetical protein
MGLSNQMSKFLSGRQPATLSSFFIVEPCEALSSRIYGSIGLWIIDFRHFERTVEQGLEKFVMAGPTQLYLHKPKKKSEA